MVQCHPQAPKFIEKGFLLICIRQLSCTHLKIHAKRVKLVRIWTGFFKISEDLRISTRLFVLYQSIQQFYGCKFNFSLQILAKKANFYQKSTDRTSNCIADPKKCRYLSHFCSHSTVAPHTNEFFLLSINPRQIKLKKTKSNRVKMRSDDAHCGAHE